MAETGPPRRTAQLTDDERFIVDVLSGLSEVPTKHVTLTMLALKHSHKHEDSLTTIKRRGARVFADVYTESGENFHDDIKLD